MIKIIPVIFLKHVKLKEVRAIENKTLNFADGGISKTAEKGSSPCFCNQYNLQQILDCMKIIKQAKDINFRIRFSV